MVGSVFAQEFVALLNAKFEGKSHFSVSAGRKYDRIVANNSYVHAFVERQSGGVYKAAGWKAPAKGVRFASVEDAAEAADMFGSYLYAK